MQGSRFLLLIPICTHEILSFPLILALFTSVKFPAILLFSGTAQFSILHRRELFIKEAVIQLHIPYGTQKHRVGRGWDIESTKFHPQLHARIQIKVSFMITPRKRKSALLHCTSPRKIFLTFSWTPWNLNLLFCVLCPKQPKTGSDVLLSHIHWSIWRMYYIPLHSWG